jgi:hypothetical protein
LAYYLTLKMEVMCSFGKTDRSVYPEGTTIYSRRCDRLKSNTYKYFLIPNHISSYFLGAGASTICVRMYEMPSKNSPGTIGLSDWFSRFFYWVCEAIGTPGLLFQPRVIVKMIVEKQMECRLAGGTEVLGENLPQRHFCPSRNPT